MSSDFPLLLISLWLTFFKLSHCTHPIYSLGWKPEIALLIKAMHALNVFEQKCISKRIYQSIFLRKIWIPFFSFPQTPGVIFLYSWMIDSCKWIQLSFVTFKESLVKLSFIVKIFHFWFVFLLLRIASSCLFNLTHVRFVFFYGWFYLSKLTKYWERSIWLYKPCWLMDPLGTYFLPVKKWLGVPLATDHHIWVKRNMFWNFY